MRLQSIAFLVLFVFVAGIAPAAVDDLWRSASGSDPISHTEGSPCLDPDDRGHPCGPACACTCCPGHAITTMFVPQQFSFAPPACEELNLSTYDVLHPKDVHFRIFHPPRA